MTPTEDHSHQASLLTHLTAEVPGSVLDQEGLAANLSCPSTCLESAVAILVVGGYALAGIVVEADGDGWLLRYPFVEVADAGQIDLLVAVGEGQAIPSISQLVFSADWQEREVEDLFGLQFAGHPLLGDFALHNEDWPEGVAPMRQAAGDLIMPSPKARAPWRPTRVVESAGAFSMSVGPVFSGVAESVQFRLESEGEEILNGVARLFYKYRGLERIAEGRQLRDVVLLAERLNGSAAFAHGLALCQAAEALSQTVVPERAQQLRVVFAEVERLRSHTSQIADLAESTGLAVPTALLSSIVEDLLRLSQVASRHRYLMGVVCPGGLTIDLGPGSAERLGSGADRASAALIKVVQQLERDNGFLDRVEQVGILTSTTARHYGVVGPMGRASGVGGDLRTAHPYAAYKEAAVRVAGAEEGDAYARLRVLVAEAMESSRLITQGIARLAPGPVQVDWRPAAGAALGWVEAPAGAAFHWLRLDALGTVQRWRVMPGSFTNWHALTPLVEGFSFQDFPIILASLGLSVAESDR